VLAAWSIAAADRARRRAGAAGLVAALSAAVKRRNFQRWASQAALAATEIDNTVAALEHRYDRCLRGHLRAWAGLIAERRSLWRGAELLVRGRRVAAVAAALRLWRRQAARAREATLRQCRIKVNRRGLGICAATSSVPRATVGGGGSFRRCSSVVFAAVCAYFTFTS